MTLIKEPEPLLLTTSKPHSLLKTNSTNPIISANLGINLSIGGSKRASFEVFNKSNGQDSTVFPSAVVVSIDAVPIKTGMVNEAKDYQGRGASNKNNYGEQTNSQ